MFRNKRFLILANFSFENQAQEFILFLVLRDLWKIKSINLFFYFRRRDWFSIFKGERYFQFVFSNPNKLKKKKRRQFYFYNYKLEGDVVIKMN